MRRRKKGSSDLNKEYELLAMRADKRLQRLEQYAKRDGMESLLKGAYARAMRDIEIWSGKGHKRFKTKIPIDPETGLPDENILRAKINDIRSFLRADTSTLKPGIDTQGYAISVYQRQADTFNQRYGSNFTWQELANFYGSKKAQRIADRIKASKSVARALGEFKRLHEKDPKKTGAALKREIEQNPNIKLSDDAVTDDIMKRMIEMGISPRTLFKGSN